MASKDRAKIFFCKECGNEYSKWMGQCPSCGAWNSFEEGLSAPKGKKTVSRADAAFAAPGARLQTKPVKLSAIETNTQNRYSTGMEELDRVLGGGIVPGSLVLVGGDPGIGKSTLLLQMCRILSQGTEKILYVSGEESLEQIRMRADRMGDFGAALSILGETCLERIIECLAADPVKTVIIDSIQTMYSEDVDAAPGSISQVRETTGKLLQVAKGQGITVFIVGHVTKEGVVAGPRMLEHMVDTVLYFEGDRHASYRILRAVKNRFGSTNEIGVFEMRQDGLAQVKNPSEYMLNGRPQQASGSVVTCAMEGTRPVLVEIQALVCRSAFGNPRRTAAGCDYNRVNLLMAVLEKRLGLQMGDMDAYVNVAGGLRMNEPAIDLGIVLAILSSYRDTAVGDDVLCFGEVGLGGEVRSVSAAEQRISEAARLGFHKVIIPQVSLKGVRKADYPGVEIIGVSSVAEAYRAIC